MINEEVIPMDKPVIIASNHPTAFIEPVILACWLKRDLHFIVRGDLFVHPIYRRMLLDLNMIPIYRKIDVKDYGDLKKNFDTLNYCYDLLGKGELIHILAEGNTIQEKRLRPLQKGTARMAFGTLDKYGEDTDIYIIPTGVNYTYADKMRSEVMIEFGKPLRVADYLADYKSNKNKAIRNLTRDLRTELKPLLVTINEVEDEEVTEHLFTIYRNNFPEKILPITKHNMERLLAEKNTGHYVNNLDESTKTALKKQVGTYFSLLNEHDLTDYGVRFPQKSSFVNTLILVIGFIPYCLGMLFNYFSVYFAKRTAKNKVKQREFKSPILWAVTMGSQLIFAIVLFIAALIIGKWQFWVFAILIPVWGYLAILYTEFYRKWRAAKRFNALDANIQSELSQQRHAISNKKFWERTNLVSTPHQ